MDKYIKNYKTWSLTGDSAICKKVITLEVQVFNIKISLFIKIIQNNNIINHKWYNLINKWQWGVLMGKRHSQLLQINHAKQISILIQTFNLCLFQI